MKSRGLGDTIERFTQTTGIKTFAQFAAKVTGQKDCGCKKRKEALNKKFPYKNKKT
jgi:hypothetical protein